MPQGRTFRNPREGTGGAYGVPFVGATTGSTKLTLDNYGVTVLTSGANTWTLAPPTQGVIKRLVSVTTGSSAARVVQLSSDGAASVKVLSAGNAFTRITFNSTDVMYVELLGINSTAWLLTRASTGAGAIGTTGIVFATS